jgi:NTP pyrophosphatase (non-canonical NTP hydrolase)
MSDPTTTFADVREAIRSFVRARDWEQFHSPKNLSMALAAEAAELMEHFLWQDSAASQQALLDPVKARAVRDELADIIIYCLEFANIAGIDVCDAIRAKMAENDRKYPVDKARGNARKYTEL